VHHVERAGPPEEILRHRRRDVVAQDVYPGRQPHHGVSLCLLEPWQRRVDSRRHNRHVVAHRRLVPTHRVDVVLPAALRVRIHVLCDPEDSHSVETFRVEGQEHSDARLYPPPRTIVRRSGTGPPTRAGSGTVSRVGSRSIRALTDRPVVE